LKEGKTEKEIRLMKKERRRPQEVEIVEVLMISSHRALRLNLASQLVCNISMKTPMRNHLSASTIQMT